MRNWKQYGRKSVSSSTDYPVDNQGMNVGITARIGGRSYQQVFPVDNGYGFPQGYRYPFIGFHQEKEKLSTYQPLLLLLLLVIK